MKRFILLNLLILILFGLSSVAQGAPQWQVTVWVKSGGGENRLVMGADDTATDAADNAWDSYAMLGGALRAYFPHPEWNLTHQVFWRDIRAKAPGTTTEWSFVVESDMDNDAIVTWDLSRVAESFTIVLIDDASGEVTDMYLTASYSFLYTDVRSFTVAVTVPADIPLPDAPVGLWATTSGESHVVTLHWLANAEDDIAGYNVYRSLISGSGYNRLNNDIIRAGKGMQINYLDKGLEAGKTYYYVVTAVNTSGGESGYSDEVSVTK